MAALHIYSIKRREVKNPVPLTSFMNLTTPCTSLKFNSSSEILVACSAFTGETLASWYVIWIYFYSF